MSIFISESSLWKISLAKTWAVKVLPTPVGPKNKNEPWGLESLLMPVALLRSVSVTADKTESCPTMWRFNIDKDFAILEVGVEIIAS